MAYSQQRELTQKEMNEDINFLVRTIKEVNPHLTVREQVTKSNLLLEMDSLLQTGNRLSSFEEFYYTAKRILLLCQDQHDDFQSHFPKDEEKNNPFLTQEAIELSRLSQQTYDLYLPWNSLGICYINGSYYFAETHYDDNNDILIPAGAKLLYVNDIAIDDYVTKYNRRCDNSVRWDFNFHKYYTHRIYFPFISGVTDKMEMILKYSINDSVRTLNYTGSRTQGNKAKDEHESAVSYFRKNKILYIRIPAMDMKNRDFYIQNILRHKNEPVEKIVIDIRNNGGGNDSLWINVMSAILDNPFRETEEKMYVRNTPFVRDYISIRGIKINEKDTVSIGNDNFVRITGDDDVPITAASLNYSGKIYVLVNEHCFSSALAFSATCNRMKKVITVGQTSNYVGGRGITPFFFVLPNSKLIFSISPVLDASDVKSVEDYYDRFVKIPVMPTIDDYVFERNYEGKRYGEEFLFNHDPVFRKVLELP
jgi:hypothetical protein